MQQRFFINNNLILINYSIKIRVIIGLRNIESQTDPRLNFREVKVCSEFHWKLYYRWLADDALRSAKLKLIYVKCIINLRHDLPFYYPIEVHNCGQ